MILVTGATGRIGRRVVQRLVADHEPVRVLVRSAQKAQRLLPNGIEIFEGDMAEYDVVHRAVDHTTAVLLVSPIAPNQVELQGNVVTAAQATSRPYIVKISGLATAIDSKVDSGHWHAETERQIQSCGLSHTFLRPLFFMQNLSFLLGLARSEGVIRAGVGDAKIAMVDAEDIAEVATQLLVERRLLLNQAVTLTAENSVTYHDVASLLTQLLGRDVRYEPQTLQDVQLALENSDLADWHVDIMHQFNRVLLAGQAEVAGKIVADVLGRPATTLKQYLQREVQGSERNDGSNPFPSS